MTKPKIRVVRKARRVVKNKFKTSKSFAKRFTENSQGLIVANSSGRRHNASNRNATQHLSSKGTFVVCSSNVKAPRRMMGLKSSFKSNPYQSEVKSLVISKRVSKIISLLKQCQE